MGILLRLLYVFTKVGVLAYGGGPSMIPLVQIEVVDNSKWMSLTEFMDTLAMGYSLPGPIATKMAAAVGYRVAGFKGAISALLGIALPSAIMMLVMVIFFMHLKDHPMFGAMMKGIRPVILALLALVVYQMFPKSVVSPLTGLIGLGALVIMIFFKVHPAFLIIAGGSLGMIFFR